MIGWIARLGFASALALLLSGWTPAEADDGYVYPPGAAPSEKDRRDAELGYPREYDRVPVPAWGMKFAYEAFIGDGKPVDPVKAMNELRIFALTHRLDKVRDNLAWAEGQGWDDDFLELFRQAITWADDLWQRDGAYAWEQAKIEAARGEHESFGRIAFFLRSVSWRKDFAPAKYDTAISRYFNRQSDGYNPSLGFSTLSELGDRGFEPAIQQLIERHLTGDDLIQHAGAAYYWLKRGDAFGFDLSPWRSRVERMASERDRSWAESFLKEGTYPGGWDFR